MAVWCDWKTSRHKDDMLGWCGQVEREADRWVSRWMDDRWRGRWIKVDNRCSYLGGQVEEEE